MFKKRRIYSKVTKIGLKLFYIKSPVVAKATDGKVTLLRHYFHSQFMLSHWSSLFLVSLSPLIVMTNQAIETHTDNKSPRAKNIFVESSHYVKYLYHYKYVLLLNIFDHIKV